jgi:hypothetical protein
LIGSKFKVLYGQSKVNGNTLTVKKTGTIIDLRKNAIPSRSKFEVLCGQNQIDAIPAILSNVSVFGAEIGLSPKLETTY